MVGRQTDARPHPGGSRQARDRDRLPGPGALRQPRHRAEHVPGPRTDASRTAGRGVHGERSARDAHQPRRDDGPLGPAGSGVPLGWTAPVCGHCQGGLVELQARDHGRAHRCTRGRPDRHGPGPGAKARRSRSRGVARLAQHERRVRGCGPDRRAATGPDGRRATRRGDVPAGCGGPHDDGCVDEGDHNGRAPTPEAGKPAGADLSVGAAPVADSAGAYLRASLVRTKGGETGVLPVVAGLLLVSILFQVANSHFLTAGNLVNLLVQAAVFALLAMGEVFALLLGEIDLSIGFVAGLSAVVMAEMVQPARGWPWWAAILAAVVVCALIGVLQGSLIARIGLPPLD